MKQVESRLGPTASLLVRTPVSRGPDGQMQGFGRARIRGTLLGPLNRDAAKIIRARSQRLQCSVLARSQSLGSFQKVRGRRRLQFILYIFGWWAALRRRRFSTPVVVPIAVDIVYGGGSTYAGRYKWAQARKLERQKCSRKAACARNSFTCGSSDSRESAAWIAVSRSSSIAARTNAA